MIRTLKFVAPLMLPLCGAAWAQDVQGIERCTRETAMDRRTGCLQSNIEYLQGVIAKNAAEARQRLTAATGEITALKAENGALKTDVAALRAALATLHGRLDKLEAAAKAPAKAGEKAADKPASPAAK